MPQQQKNSENFGATIAKNKIETLKKYVKMQINEPSLATEINTFSLALISSFLI